MKEYLFDLLWITLKTVTTFMRSGKTQTARLGNPAPTIKLHVSSAEPARWQH